jgi:hypothetical protein
MLTVLSFLPQLVLLLPSPCQRDHHHLCTNCTSKYKQSPNPQYFFNGTSILFNRILHLPFKIPSALSTNMGVLD